MTELDVLIIISGQLDTLISLLAPVNNSSLVIIQYGQVFIPWILIVLMLWWFFSQFMGRYR